ncbi:MAG TPA: hypothetical protein VGE92_05745 [Steroidobacteraceae bacterium]
MKFAPRRTALLAIMVAPTLSWAAPPMSPDTGSDAVRALHSQRAGELELQYRREVRGASTDQVSFGIAADYHYVKSADGTRIYDYRSRRIFWLRPAGEFVNNSLYADVWFRAAELKNRSALGGMLNGAGIAASKAPGMTVPFWAETELGMLSADMPRSDLKTVEEESRVRWLLDADEVAAVRYERDPVPDTVKSGLRRFWRTVVQLHPDIADALAASGRMPAELWIKSMPPGKDPLVAHWTLAAKRWEPAAAYPLPAHLTAQPTNSDAVFSRIFATLAMNVAAKATPPSAEVYVARAESAIARRAGLEAMLWAIEMNLAQGTPISQCVEKDPRPYCSLLVRAGPLAKADPRTALGFTKQAPAEADRAQFAALPNAYLLRLLWATRPPGAGVDRKENERDLLAALEASPVANFCKDTGDFYAGSWQPFAAWQAWDFGRAMAGHRSGDLLGGVDALEASLASQEALFF